MAQKDVIKAIRKYGSDTRKGSFAYNPNHCNQKDLQKENRKKKASAFAEAQRKKIQEKFN